MFGPPKLEGATYDVRMFIKLKKFNSAKQIDTQFATGKHGNCHSLMITILSYNYRHNWSYFGYSDIYYCICDSDITGVFTDHLKEDSEIQDIT